MVEFEVQAGVGVREGIAGPMFDSKTGQVLPGGVKQINFAKENAYTDPDKFIIDLDSIKEIKWCCQSPKYSRVRTAHH